MGNNAPPVNARAFAVLLDAIAPPAELRTAYDQLKPTEQLFVDEYVASDDPRGAAIRVSEQSRGRTAVANPDARALDYIKRPLVQAAIAERRKAVMQRLDISAERVLQEVAKLAFSNMGDYVRITGDGEPYTDLSNVSLDQMAAISEVTTEDFTDGRGDDARDVKKVKIKLYDKLAALEKLMKYHGLFAPDRLEVSGPNGKPIQTVGVTVDMTPREAADLYAATLGE